MEVSIMRAKLFIIAGLATLALVASAAVARALPGPGTTPAHGSGADLVDAVRDATSQFKKVSAAEQAGYGLFHGCVSGPEEGAMGIHYVKGDLVGDGVVDAAQPEALMYEVKNGQLRLTGVEYVVLAADWDAAHPNGEPPVLMGQVFNYVGSPNRYRIPAFYELHVWAWKHNPDGTFADWNPWVSCEDYAG
jgi:hypothetical protein